MADSRLQGITYPTDKYWADEEDPKLLCGYLRDKIGSYQDRLERSHLLTRILRSWKYYHGMFYSRGQGPSAISILGEQGEVACLSINELRSQAQQILSIVTGQRPAFDAKAVNSDMESLYQAKRGNQTLDFYDEKEGLENYLVTAFEHSLIFLQGFVYTIWDESKGKEVNADPTTGFLIREGDLGLHNPTIFDIARDTRIRDWNTDVRWVCVRTLHNKWDLAARFPEVRDDILRYSEESYEELEWCPIQPWNHDGEDNDPDLMGVWTFHHLQTDALPDGRLFRFFGETALPGQDMADPYGWNPLSRVVCGEYLLAPDGYSPILDLQGINEAINGEASSILSTHRAYGRPIVWQPTGTNLAENQIEGFVLLEGDAEPKAINLGQVPPDIYQNKRDLRQDGEYVTGVNSVARGQPVNKEASGSALALIDAKASQAASPAIRSYNRLVATVGTKILRILDTFLSEDEERMISITGKHSRNYEVALKRGSFSRIDRVQVIPGNAITRSLSGRFQLLDYISRFPSADGSPMLKTPEEIMNLVLNGSFEPLTESEMAELTVVRDENQEMLAGRPVTAMIMDNHVLHIREHKAQLNTTQARMDPTLSSIVGAHIMEHVTLLLQGGVAGAYLQALLGYTPPPMPMMPGMTGMPGEGQENPVGQEGTKPGENPPAPPGPNPDSSPAQMPRNPSPGGQPAEMAV